MKFLVSVLTLAVGCDANKSRGQRNYAGGVFSDKQALAIIVGKNGLLPDIPQVFEKNVDQLKASGALKVLSIYHIQKRIFDYLAVLFPNFCGEFIGGGGLQYFISSFDEDANLFITKDKMGQYGIKSMNVIDKNRFVPIRKQKHVRLTMRNNWLYDSVETTDLVVVWQTCETGQPDPKWSDKSKRPTYKDYSWSEHDYRFVMWRPEVQRIYNYMIDIGWIPDWDFDHFQQFPLTYLKRTDQNKFISWRKSKERCSETHVWRLEDMTLANLPNLIPPED